MHDGEETGLIADTVTISVALKTPAVIISVTTPDTLSVRVSYDWKMLESSAEDTRNFQVRRLSDSAVIPVISSTLQADSQTVKLTVDSLLLGIQYIVVSDSVFNEVNFRQITTFAFFARKFGDFGGSGSATPDSSVNFDDILIFALSFGSNHTSPGWNPVCDISSDTPSAGRIDSRDLLQLLPRVE